MEQERRGDPLDRTAILRSGTGGLVPSTFATGYRYSLLGYTTVIEAAGQFLLYLAYLPLFDLAVRSTPKGSARQQRTANRRSSDWRFPESPGSPRRRAAYSGSGSTTR